jgi:hypothetical protein
MGLTAFGDGELRAAVRRARPRGARTAADVQCPGVLPQSPTRIVDNQSRHVAMSTQPTQPDVPSPVPPEDPANDVPVDEDPVPVDPGREHRVKHPPSPV